jgi:hypothetical protein
MPKKLENKMRSLALETNEDPEEFKHTFTGIDMLNSVPVRFVPLDHKQQLWGQAFDNLDHLLMPPPLPRVKAKPSPKRVTPIGWTKPHGVTGSFKSKNRVRSPVPHCNARGRTSDAKNCLHHFARAQNRASIVGVRKQIQHGNSPHLRSKLLTTGVESSVLGVDVAHSPPPVDLPRPLAQLNLATVPSIISARSARSALSAFNHTPALDCERTHESFIRSGANTP